MKKLTTISLLFFICFSLSAQYKKASFFGKEGRTYGLGTQLDAMGDGKGSPVGFAITFGRDRDGKQFFSSWDLQYISSYKFSFATTNSADEPANYEEAMEGPESEKWLEAMKSEIRSMYDNQVWTLVDIPDGRRAVDL